MREKDKVLITDVKKQGEVEIALVYRENGNGKKEAERISPYKLIFDRNGEPNFAYSKETNLERAESEGMRSIWELAREGKKYIVLISPPGGDDNYPEGRLIVGKVIATGENVEIECRGMPILENGERLKEMAVELMNRGAVAMDEIREVEDLRKEAIGVEAKDWNDFLEICDNVFGNHEVWQAIKNGDDLVATAETKKVVVEVMADMFVRGYGNNPYVLERMMMGRGYGLRAGNHGGINRVKPLFGGAFNEMYGRVSTEILDPRLQRCEQCGYCYMKKKVQCPNCNPKN